METKGKAIEIITGRYGKGTPDENSMVASILGERDTEERFKIYFYWYNVIHELGHGIMAFNSASRPHPVDEEQWVNDFAVAFWLHYGEAEKINELAAIVAYALTHVKCPADAGITHTDWAREKWGTETLMNFNNYGWFQFNCVNDSLRERKMLDTALPRLGVMNTKAQPKQLFTYQTIEEATVSKIIKDAAGALREWGAVLPEIYHTFDNDPNRHMCRNIEE